MGICKLLSRFASLQVLLIISFILLMTIAGFFGFILTYVQSQKSLSEIAEAGIHDLVTGVVSVIENQIQDGHRINLHELLYFRSQKLSLTNWVDLYYKWRPFAFNALRTVPTSYLSASIVWLPNYGISLNVRVLNILFLNFNNSICNDTIYFPGSNCSVHLGEQYPLTSVTWETVWDKPIGFNIPYNITQQIYWKTGVYSQRERWKTNPTSNPYNMGYASITPYYEVYPPALNLHVQISIFDLSGNIVGVSYKPLLLNFLGIYLRKMVSAHLMLNNSGRAFCFELENNLLTGASHGNITMLTDKGTLVRLAHAQSPDPIISEAGKALPQYTGGGDTAPIKAKFKTIGKDYLCIAQPYFDPYGLAWMASVIMSKTDLFKDLNDAAMRMLGFTALGIILLSILAGFLISLIVSRSLHQLSKQMAKIADMDLENISVRKSWCYEIAMMQNYFYMMVDELKEYRAFLPEAILNDGNTKVLESDSATQGLISPTVEPEMGKQTAKVSSSQKKDAITCSSQRSYESELVLSPGSVKIEYCQEHISKQLGPMSKGTISMVFVDAVKFHGIVEQNASLMVDLYSKVIGKLLKIISTNGGMCSPIMGDKLMAFWNLRLVKTDHAIACAKTALQIFNEFQVSEGRTQQSEIDIPCSVRVSSTAGSARFGTMGTATSRSFLIFSPMIARGTLLQKLGKLIPFTVSCDGILQAMICCHFHTRLVGFTEFPDRLPEHRVFEILRSIDPRVDESFKNKWGFDDMKQHVDNTSYCTETDPHELVLRSIFDGTYPPNRAPTSSTSSSSSAPSYSSVSDDPLLTWYSSNAHHVHGLLHSEWGLTIPMQVVLSAT